MWPWVLCPRNLAGESALEWQGPCEADRHGPCKGQREIIRKCKEHDIKMQIKLFMFEDKCHSLIVLFGFLTSTEFLLNVVLDQLGHVPWSLQDVFAQVCPGKTYTTCGTPEAWPKMPKILIIGNSNCPTFSEWFCWLLLHCVTVSVLRVRRTTSHLNSSHPKAWLPTIWCHWLIGIWGIW